MATQAIRDFLLEHEMEVYLVVFDHKAFKISSSLFEDVQSYLDTRYVEELLEEEYRDDYRDRHRFTEVPTYLGDEGVAGFEDEVRTGSFIMRSLQVAGSYVGDSEE